MSTRRRKQEQIASLRNEASSHYKAGAILLGAAALLAPLEVGAIEAYHHDGNVVSQVVMSVGSALLAGGVISLLNGVSAKREATATENSLASTRLKSYAGPASIPRESLPFMPSVEPRDAVPPEPQDAVLPTPMAE